MRDGGDSFDVSEVGQQKLQRSRNPGEVQRVDENRA